ncbi:TPA: hypothetical protein ACNE19_004777, partial [Escherichia coli]
HVLHISPWLSGGSPVEALFLPVATVIQQEMEIRYPPKGFKKLWRKYLLSPDAKWHLNRSQFGIRIDHDLASISDHSLASQSITIWHASDH